MPDADRPTLVYLHFLGGSALSWEPVADRLAACGDRLALDLPGFGAAANLDGYSVAAMVDRVADAMRLAAPRRWILVGHSMGAKLAAVLARRAEDGEAGLSGLVGLVLLAGSPPGSEPMEEGQRRAMLGWFRGDDAAKARGEADGYITQNVGAPLAPVLHDQAVADVLRMCTAAWTAWLDHGSREDWAARVGRLRTPALLIAGSEDAALGPAAQTRLTVPHFDHVRQATLPGAGHLLPLERAEAVAALIADQVAAWLGGIGADYMALIASDRVSARTRALLLARAAPDDPAYVAVTLSPAQFATLRAVIGRVVPQTTPQPIDLAARLDAMLGRGEGDGWRFALLPPDIEAYRAGLDTLDVGARALEGRAFARLDGARQDDLLERVGDGRLGDASAPPGQLDARQMKLWFEDVRGAAIRIYVAHPATLARMGFSGIAYGGDGEPKSGFVELGVGVREPWEPEAAAGASA